MNVIVVDNVRSEALFLKLGTPVQFHRWQPTYQLHVQVQHILKDDAGWLTYYAIDNDLNWKLLCHSCCHVIMIFDESKLES